MHGTPPKIYFIPSYIGTLKYFLRVAAPLQSTYDVRYLIIHPDKKREREMVAFCREHGLTCAVISPDSETFVRLPLLTPLWRRYLHSRKCRAFLQEKKPVKLISSKTKHPHDTIIKEANRLGIETILLQWAFYWRRYGDDYRTSRRASLLEKLYFGIVHAVAFIFDLPFKESRLTPSLAMPQKVGVFDETEAEYRARFFDPRIIKVVGTPDFQTLHELKSKIDTEKSFKEKLLAKYHLDPNKKRIVFIFCRYYPDKKDDYGLAPEKHIAYYYELLKMARSVFPEEEAELYVKLRPSEGNAYESYGELGVKFFGDEANTEELVALSDLYIAYPETSVNYMALGSGIPALFVNLTPLSSPKKCIETFHIRHVVTEKTDFLEKLQLFKSGNLLRQYDNSSTNFKSLDTIVRFICDVEREK